MKEEKEEVPKEVTPITICSPPRYSSYFVDIVTIVNILSYSITSLLCLAPMCLEDPNQIQH